MTSNLNLRRFGSAASPLALGVALALAASPAAAQDATPTITGAASQDTAGAPPPADEGSVIVVRGFRAALQSATAKKKRSETVVESVSAEDIGKLPDNSIGESIARLPGLAAQRSNGRANIISIRGFGPDFSTTTLNGREQTTTNDSRAVEFDQFPSEILAGVDVYKTAQADHTAGGLVGSIDLRTIRPLDYRKPVIAVGARGTYVDQKVIPTVTDKGYRVYGTFVDQFAQDRLGVALSAAYSDEPYQTHDWNAWGYGGYGGNNYGISGVKTWSEASRLKRLGLNGTVQAKFTDNLTLTVDGFYSHFNEKLDQKGFEMPILCCGSTVTSFQSTPLGGGAAGAGGLVTSATWTGRPLIENYATDNKNNTYALAGNLKWDNFHGTRAFIDLSWSRTDRNQDRLETTAGLGRNLPTTDQAGNPLPVSSYGGTFGYTVTDNNALLFTSSFNGANPALVLTDVEGWSGSPIQAGYDKIRRSRDDLKEARAEVEQDIGGFVRSIKVGVDHTYRKKNLTQQEAVLSPPNGASSIAIPSNLLLTPVQLDRGFGPILSYDPRTLVPGGILVYNANTFGNSQAYNISENVWSPYAMANFDHDLGNGNTLTGNLGVQAIHTGITSQGAINPTIKNSFWMVLPSLNLNFRSADGLVVRFAASEQMMRPRLPDMNNIVGFSYNPAYNPPIYTGGGGNPLLRPYKAAAVDLSFEKYFATKGYVALQLYYKHLIDYIDPSANVTNFDYSGFPKPPGLVPSSPIGVFSGPVNTKGGHIAGAELAATLPFDVFTPALEGFGITGGLGYSKTKAMNAAGQEQAIPGYSKWVGSLTAFYERYGFNLRGSMRYRSSFLGDFSLFSGGLDRQAVLAETVYDAQVGYDFPANSSLHGLSLYLQGQNLTDERQATLAQINGLAVPNAWLKYQTYGRRFLAGFTYKF
ncbi:TonB-dependent receptor [Sphingomonas sp. KRR8]|uniref:TonB-dependent receptor n=1 Tax=Sphingomonas sp. KRR8 TaxID=2942996 RepID=UPI002020C4E3|nr:TonB-dependent receptor [Sphingomonas sp. KRR8]URD60938.1 TonB-dependent receptor [Sphingomonas sp. KRR8]URD60946.1 TonB-dependent receptor [Sphingomonas sp. KRR8]